MNKVYTAQDMREAADNFWVGGVICEVKDEDGRVVKHINHDSIVAMLRYAADLVERCEAELALTDKSHYTYSRLEYILRGDAGKEEK